MSVGSDLWSNLLLGRHHDQVPAYALALDVSESTRRRLAQDHGCKDCAALQKSGSGRNADAEHLQEREGECDRAMWREDGQRRLLLCISPLY